MGQRKRARKRVRKTIRKLGIFAAAALAEFTGKLLSDGMKRLSSRDDEAPDGRKRRRDHAEESARS
jgi:hypothetical protein